MTKTHTVDIEYSPAYDWEARGTTTFGYDVSAYRWCCACGTRSGWFCADDDTEPADAQASIAAILDSRRHGAYPEETVVNPAAGTVNEDGAVWGGNRWHLVAIESPVGIGAGAARATCSCGWNGPTFVKRSTDLGRGATVIVSPNLVATEDGQYHTWEVSQRLVTSTGDEQKDPR